MRGYSCEQPQLPVFSHTRAVVTKEMTEPSVPDNGSALNTNKSENRIVRPSPIHGGHLLLFRIYHLGVLNVEKFYINTLHQAKISAGTLL